MFCVQLAKYSATVGYIRYRIVCAVEHERFRALTVQAMTAQRVKSGLETILRGQMRL